MSCLHVHESVKNNTAKPFLQMNKKKELMLSQLSKKDRLRLHLYKFIHSITTK
jgi:hypothetical protein